MPKVFTNVLKKHKLIVLSLVLFLIFFPLVNSIDYVQNDEYTHYRLIENFLKGNFKLDPYIGATFYLQGVMGMIFAKVFGISKLPVLTLIISVFSFYIFMKILNKFFKRSVLDSILLGLLLFLNPLYLYSTVGFMTENYFVFFLLLSIYFIFEYDRSGKIRGFVFANLFITASYLVRQFAFVTSIAYAVYLLASKKYKLGSIQLGLFILLLVFHYKVFPITPQMYEGGVNVGSLLNFERTFPLVYVFLIYVVMFLLPMVILSFVKEKKLGLIILIFSIPIFVFVAKKFEPGKITFASRIRGEQILNFASAEFPYLGNVFGKKGFMEKDVIGNKYAYPGYFDLFKLWNLSACFFAVGLVIVSVRNIKKFNRFSLIYTVFFIGLLIVAPRVYDRYLLPLILVTVILLSSALGNFDKLDRIIISGFVLFLFVLGYEFLMDFYTLNRYVWERSGKISREWGVPKESINPTHAWRMLFPKENGNNRWDYLFKYDPIEIRPNDKCCFKVIEVKTLGFPLSFYKESKVYLYERNIW
jgi:hypothetical protein